MIRTTSLVVLRPPPDRPKVNRPPPTAEEAVQRGEQPLRRNDHVSSMKGFTFAGHAPVWTSVSGFPHEFWYALHGNWFFKVVVGCGTSPQAGLRRNNNATNNRHVRHPLREWHPARFRSSTLTVYHQNDHVCAKTSWLADSDCFKCSTDHRGRTGDQHLMTHMGAWYRVLSALPAFLRGYFGQFLMVRIRL